MKAKQNGRLFKNRCALTPLVLACVALMPALGLAQDAYEPDNDATEAGWIGVDGPVQAHDIHVNGDEDWAMFWAWDAETIYIDVANPGTDLDAVIEVYEGDGTTFIDDEDSAGAGSPESLVFVANTVGPPDNGAFYYVRVYDYDGLGGGDRGYDLHVYTLTGGDDPGDINGLVRNAITAQPIAGAQVILQDFGNLKRISDGDGLFEYKTMPISKVVTFYATAAGYQANDTQQRIITSGPQDVTIELMPLSTPPTAAFSADPLSGPAPLTVTFTDESTPGSTPIDSWSWTFGDGQTSSDQHPVIIYNTPGQYTVSLTVSSASGSDDEVKTEYITATTVTPVGPTANFSADRVNGVVPLEVSFTDLSTAGSAPIDSWAWTFGDGQTSADQHPVITYTTPGQYTVSLTVTTTVGSSTKTEVNYITATAVSPVGPTADFSAAPRTGAGPTLTVQFDNLSSPGNGADLSWFWNFGDGDTSNEEEPSHTYMGVGKYTVRLTVTTSAGSDTAVKANYIVVGEDNMPASGLATLLLLCSCLALTGASRALKMVRQR